MTLEVNANLGKGGAGMQGQGPGTAHAMLTELQGLTQSLLAGVGANTKIDLAAIRLEDTIIGALNNNAGTITDVLSTLSIVDVRASGTLTFVSAVAGNTATVNGKLYTAVAGVPANTTQFSIDTSDTATAASLAAAINEREKNDANAIFATSALGVVTVRATAEGTGGNAITLAKVGAPITLSAGTLAGGTLTGGIQSTGATNQVILTWFNKK
jgi:hypothetical protein